MQMRANRIKNEESVDMSTRRGKEIRKSKYF